MQRRVYFFCGTSAVGKTTLLQSLDPKRFLIESLSARTPRAKLGNPSFSDLIADHELAFKHQQFVFDFFVDEIYNILMRESRSQTDDRALVFERSLWDVAGYTSAFKLGGLLQLQADVVSGFDHQIQRGIWPQRTKWIQRIVRFEIDPKIPYAEDPARPNAAIRDSCDVSLTNMLRWHNDTTITPEQMLRLEEELSHDDNE